MKKIFTLALVLALLCSLLTGTVLAAGYSDVSENAWYQAAVADVTAKGLMVGTGSGKFSPDVALDRAMIVTILHRIDGTPAPKTAAVFTDVKAGTWYTEAVSWASENGLVYGYGDGRFGPTDTLTREQLCAIIQRFLKPKSDSDPRANLDSYQDASGISRWAVDAVQWAVGQNLLRITNNQLRATQAATRADTAYVISAITRGYDPQDPVEVMRAAQAKMNALDSLDASFTMDLRLVSDRMETDIPVTGTLQASGLQSRTPLMRSHYQSSIMGQSLNLDLFTDYDELYVDRNGERYRYLLTEEDRVTDLMLGQAGLSQELLSQTGSVRNATLVLNADGSKTVSYTVPKEQAQSLLRSAQAMPSGLTANGGQVTDISDVQVTANVLATGYLGKLTLQYDAKVLENGEYYTAHVLTSTTFLDPGKQVRVEAPNPNDYVSFEGLISQLVEQSNP